MTDSGGGNRKSSQSGIKYGSAFIHATPLAFKLSFDIGLKINFYLPRKN
jgi:hypothetical protein